ncbi:hypothetical protein [Photobacterium nomapromontoriensis]|uniref:hypothetical protein n=1 Tax=Photobacterium nomapromontoriensis TaxID=2910237 RepID=UPI003D0E7EE4
MRLYVVRSAGQYQTEQDRTGICPALGITEHPSFTTRGDRVDLSFNPIVVYRITTIFNVPF